jgi:Mce-associated membrane protein
MEGDAGAGRLNPTDAHDPSLSEVKTEDLGESEVGTDQASTVVKTEDLGESEVGTDQASTVVKTEDLGESEVGTDKASTLVITEAPATNAEDVSEAALVVTRGPSRLGRRWLIGITAALLLLAGGVGAGGCFALRAHFANRTIARDDRAAIEAAKECVAATQAPDLAAMADSARKIVECSTGDFGAQAALYSGLLVEAYRAANAHVQVSDMRAAVERNNGDGSIDVLVALRVKVSNAEAKDQESGYRLRVKMTSDDGRYKISKLEQVTK